MITVYSFENAVGEDGSWTTLVYDEAKDYARKYGLLLVANNYEFSEREQLEDYRPSTRGRPGRRRRRGGGSDGPASE